MDVETCSEEDSGQANYFRLRTTASWPEIGDFGGLNGPVTPKPIGKGGLRPPPFPMGFAVGGGRLDS